MLNIKRRAQSGLSLIELMIAITLGLIILAALLAVFVANNQSANQTDATAELQDNARAALDILGRDLSMAGYWGGMYGTSAITPCNLGTSCGTTQITTTATAANPLYECGSNDSNGIQWAFQFANRIEFADQLDTGSAAAATRFPCLDSSVLQPGSDVVAIRRAAGQSAVDVSPTATSAKLTPYNFYLYSNGITASVMRAPSTGVYPGSGDPPLLANTSFYKYVARLYYVRKYDHKDASGNPDNIPSLCRAELCGSGFNAHGGSTMDSATCGDGAASASGFYAQCIADGIESLQVEWGLNLNRTSGSDCMVDTSTSQPQAAQLSAYGLSARISVLVRSSQIDGSYTDNKVYNFADYSMTQAKADHYHRRIYSTTVQLRNPNGDSGLCTH